MSGTRTIQSLERALGILEAVSDAPRGLSLAELARTRGLKPPTAHHLAGTLVARGYLLKTRHPLRYRIGPMFFEMASGYRDHVDSERLEAILRAGVDHAPLAVWTLARPAGGDLRVMMRMSPDRPGIIQKPRGRMFGPYNSASGLAYLAFCEPEDRWLFENRHSFDERGSTQWANRDALECFLGQARDRGVVVLKKDAAPGFLVAAPVLAPEEGLEAILGAACADRAVAAYREEEMVECVLAAARTCGAGRQARHAARGVP